MDEVELVNRNLQVSGNYFWRSSNEHERLTDSELQFGCCDAIKHLTKLCNASRTVPCRQNQALANIELIKKHLITSRLIRKTFIRHSHTANSLISW